MMKIGLAYAGPFQFATLRFCLGAVCLIPVLIKVGVPLFPARHQQMIFGALVLALGWLCFEAGIFRSCETRLILDTEDTVSQTMGIGRGCAVFGRNVQGVLLH